MSETPDQRRTRILAASATRAQSAPPPSPAASPAATSTMFGAMPNPAPVAPPKKEPYAGSPAKGVEITIVPKGTKPNPNAARSVQQGAISVDAGRPRQRSSPNVQPVHGVRAQSGGVVQRQGPANAGVRRTDQPAQAPRQSPQSAPGAQVSRQASPVMRVPASTAPVVDLSVVCAYHSRPALIEPQQRHLLAQSVQPMGRVAWINPTGERFTPAIQLILDQQPHVRPNIDMGQWMRWSVASQCTTEFVLVIDDDCLPGPRWIESALGRLQQTQDPWVVAAAGICYASDRSDDIRLIGPESPPSAEVEVDVGRGAWMMRTSTARQIASQERFMEQLSTGIHVASVVQGLGGLTLVLPYERDRASWGMLEAPRTDGSMSVRMAQAAADGQSPPVDQLRDAIYHSYREEGWMPSVVVASESAAEIDTVRMTADQAE